MQADRKRVLKSDDEEDARTEGIFEEELEDRKLQAKACRRGSEPLPPGEKKRRTKKTG